jgi:dethiobiotin synthetase
VTCRFVVAGTDTNVGKTVFSAALAGALNAYYWKPVQAGLQDETDSQVVARLSGLRSEKILPEAYRLETPASPHIAARLDGLQIAADRLSLPQGREPLVVETAGGLMTPLREDLLTIDLLGQWGLPVVLCARTSLGTINHSLLSLEALQRRNILVLGLAFVGDENEDSQRTIVERSGVRELGRLPHLSLLTPETLRFMFDRQFRLADFGARSGG